MPAFCWICDTRDIPSRAGLPSPLAPLHHSVPPGSASAVGLNYRVVKGGSKGRGLIFPRNPYSSPVTPSAWTPPLKKPIIKHSGRTSLDPQSHWKSLEEMVSFFFWQKKTNQFDDSWTFRTTVFRSKPTSSLNQWWAPLVIASVNPTWRQYTVIVSWHNWGLYIHLRCTIWRGALFRLQTQPQKLNSGAVNRSRISVEHFPTTDIETIPHKPAINVSKMCWNEKNLPGWKLVVLLMVEILPVDR